MWPGAASTDRVAAMVTTSTGLVTKMMTASGECSSSCGVSVLRHRDVGGRQVQAVLSGFLLGARSDDDDRRPGGDRDVVGSGDPAVRHELAAVVEIEHLGAHLAGVDVVERERSGRSADQAGVGDGGAHASHADDGNLGVLFHGHSPIVTHGGPPL